MAFSRSAKSFSPAVGIGLFEAYTIVKKNTQTSFHHLSDMLLVGMWEQLPQMAKH